MCLYRGTGYKTSLAVRNSAWGPLKGANEVKLQNFTHGKAQLYKAYGTLQTHPHISPAKQELVLKNKTEVCLAQDHTERWEKTEHHSSALAILSVLCKALISLAPCYTSVQDTSVSERVYPGAERQSKGNPVVTAADFKVRGRIPRRVLFVAFHTAILRWKGRREENVQK